MTNAASVNEAYGLEILPQPAVLSVHSFEAVEALDRPYRINVVFTSTTRAISMPAVLGRPARFVIEPTGQDGSGERRVWNGLITRFETLGTSKDETRYRAVLEPRISDLALQVTSRLFQHQSVPQIIEAVLRHYGLTAADFRLQLRRNYPTREYTTQFQETTLAFIQRLAADEGIWFRFENSDEREVVVFGDDLDAYVRPALNMAYREDAGLESGGAQAVKTLSQSCSRVPGSVTVDDYNHRTASVQLLSEVNAAPADTTMGTGQYLWGMHHPSPDEGKRVARLRHEALLAGQILFEGTANVHPLSPGVTLALTDHELADAPHGLLITRVEHRGSRQDAYTNSFQAIPADRVYRPAIDPAAWPMIAGVLPARVISPDNYTYGYLSPEGWYRVKLPFDLDEWSPGGSSRPVRLSRPYAGGDYGHHFPLLDGTEVSLVFTAGDPDRPIISGSLHDSDHGDHVTNLNNTRNILRTAARNEMRMEDRRTSEHVHLTTPYQISELNLGHMVDGSDKERGQGAELRTDGHAAVRAGKGILISADGQPGAAGQQLDMQAAVERLQLASQQLAAHSAEAGRVKGLAADVEALKTLIGDVLTQLVRAGVLITAPDGIGIASGGSLQLSAQESLAVTAGKGLDLSANDALTGVAGHGVSLVAQQDGMRFIAAAGDIVVQAQAAQLLMAALNAVTIQSVDGEIHISAKTRLTLDCGGSFVTLDPSNITLGTSGDFLIKANVKQMGPATQPSPGAPFSAPGKGVLEIAHLFENGVGLADAGYEVMDAIGVKHTGKLDAKGEAVLSGLPAGPVAISFLRDRDKIREFFPLQNDDDQASAANPVESAMAGLSQLGSLAPQLASSASSGVSSLAKQAASMIPGSSEVGKLVGAVNSGTALASQLRGVLPTGESKNVAGSMNLLAGGLTASSPSVSSALAALKALKSVV